MESLSDEEILLKKFRRVKAPLKMLIGEKPFPYHVPVEDLEEKVETR